MLKPHYHVAAFYPATPDGWLVKGINQIIRERCGRIGLNVKMVQESGTLLGSILTGPDLSGRLYPDYHMEESGPPHLRVGTNYTEVCSPCAIKYSRGETGFGAYARINSHEAQIRTNDQWSSMAQHLTQKHSGQTKNTKIFNFEVVTTGERPLTRQLRETRGLPVMQPPVNSSMAAMRTLLRPSSS